MQFGTINEGTENEDEKIEYKTSYRKGKPTKKFKIETEQRKVGERGNEVKDMYAFFFSLIKKYESGEAYTFGLMADGVDPKTGRISRIKLITEQQEPTE